MEQHEHWQVAVDPATAGANKLGTIPAASVMTPEAIRWAERVARYEAVELRLELEQALAREEDFAEQLLEAARQLAQVNALLTRLVGHVPGELARTLTSAQRELHHARRGLDARRMEFSEQTRSQRATASSRERLDHSRRPADSRSWSKSSRPDVSRSQPDLGQGATPASTGSERGCAEFCLEGSGCADIIVCVHNALDDVQGCLASVIRNTDPRHRIIVVDDGSDTDCASFLRTFAESYPHVTLVRSDQPLGYSRAANRGLRLAGAELVVLLNSDTVVPPRWLERLQECAFSDELIGIVGPLSNAASYQSVPERFSADGDWATNPLPDGWGVDQLAEAVAAVSVRAFPRVPFVNGFCLAIKRSVIETIGSLDEQTFPFGYGEENDYCLRARDAGFQLAIADHAYVYHAKSRSYSHAQRVALGRIGRQALLETYGTDRIVADETRLRNEPALARTRAALAAELSSSGTSTGTMNVLFLLPVSGGGGGAHSVAQEAAGMRRLGIEAQVAVRALHLARYREVYAGLDDGGQLFFGYRTPDELLAHAAKFGVVVGTIHTSMPLVAAIVAEYPSIVPAYYVQDYEPYFHPADSPEREAAEISYTLVPGAVLFAKTDWLCRTVHSKHGLVVHKVKPSIDLDLFFPPSSERKVSRVRVVAMVRPSSPRRGAGRTMEVLRRLQSELGRHVDIHIFGCSEADLDGGRLATGFRFTNHGVLTREQVAKVLRKAAVFLDFSEYQAFGRSGLEAMACGCAVVVPAMGGTDEYAVDGENALVVDTSNLEACFSAARDLVTRGKLRQRLQRAGVETARNYSIEQAALSEMVLLAEAWSARRAGVSPPAVAMATVG